MKQYRNTIKRYRKNQEEVFEPVHTIVLKVIDELDNDKVVYEEKRTIIRPTLDFLELVIDMNREYTAYNNELLEFIK